MRCHPRVLARLAAVAVLAPGALSQSPAPEPVELADGTRLVRPQLRIPFEHPSGHIAVEVMVNGKGPFRFQLDTGAGIDACVDLALVEELDLELVGTTLNSAVDMSQAVRRNLVRVDELRLGGATFRELEALSADYRWVNRKNGERVYGLLGFPLFRKMLLSIDYPSSTLILSRGELSATADHVIPFNARGRTPHVPLSIGKHELTALLDTGSPGSLSLSRAELEFVATLGPPVRTGTTRTVNASFAVYGATLREDVTLAGQSFPRLPVAIYDRHRYAIIGYRMLRRSVLTFDQKNELLRMVAPTSRRPADRK